MLGSHDNAAVECRRTTRRVAHLATSLPPDLAEQLWRDPLSVLDTGERLRSNAARRTVRLEWNGQPYVMKHYFEPTWRHALKQYVTPSRAWSTWAIAHRLADAGVVTPRPVACVENRCGILRRDSFLMYPYVEGKTLRTCLMVEKERQSTHGEHVWRQLSDLWRRLDGLRASLADANAGNFIVGPNGQLWVIDLDKARFHSVALVAVRQQQRGWRQLLRSLKKSCACMLAMLPESLESLSTLLLA